MSRTSIIFLFICFVCVTDISNGYLIKGRSQQDIFTREIQVPKDEVLDNKLGLEQELPLEVTANKKCAEIGQFCMNHKDCCSNSCLGFMKRCVS